MCRDSDDESGAMGYSDFAETNTSRTLAEQRMSRAASGGSSGQTPKSSKGFGAKLFGGANKLIGGVSSAAVGSVSAVAGGMSAAAGMVGETVSSSTSQSTTQATANAQAPASTSGGYPSGNVISVSGRIAALEAQKKDAIAADDLVLAQSLKAQIEVLQKSGESHSQPQSQPQTPATAPPPPVPKQEAQNPPASSGGHSSFTGALLGGGQALLGAGSAGVGLLSSGAKGMSSAVGFSNGRGCSVGNPVSEYSLCLVSSFYELVAASLPACGADNPQMELSSHIDAAITSRNLNDLAARLIDFWYVLRPDALSSWSLLHQQTWVWTAYGLKYGDLSAAPKEMGRAMCGLLLELALGIRSTMLTWDSEAADRWANTLRTMAALMLETPPPAGWGFPGFVIARNGPGCDELDFGQTGYAVSRSDVKGLSRSQGKEALLALKNGGVIRGRKLTRVTEDADVLKCGPRDLVGDAKALVSQAGGLNLIEKVDRKSGRLFSQKTKPVHLHNQSGIALKACLYAENDRMCAFPVGGLGGPCVTTLEPNCRAQIRPPGKDSCFQVKVMKPGMIETNLYFAVVSRGQHVQLRSHDCKVEDC